MATTDIKNTLQQTLTQKQELIRDYQSIAHETTDTPIGKLYSHFAEAEALHAVQIKEQLAQLEN